MIWHKFKRGDFVKIQGALCIFVGDVNQLAIFRRIDETSTILLSQFDYKRLNKEIKLISGNSKEVAKYILRMTI